MTREEIQHKINYYSHLVSTCTTEKEELDEKHTEAKGLLSEVNNIVSNFEAQHEAYNTGLSAFEGLSELKAVKDYVTGMSELINGTEYTSAKEGLASAVEAVEDECERLKKASEDKEKEIERNDNLRQYWQTRLDNYVDPTPVAPATPSPSAVPAKAPHGNQMVTIK